MDIDTMKRQASVAKDGATCFETGSELIRCKATGEGFEWRFQEKAYDRRGGRKINEATAATLLARATTGV